MKTITNNRLFVCFSSFLSFIYCLVCTTNATNIRKQGRRQQRTMVSACKFEFVSLNYACFILKYLTVVCFFVSILPFTTAFTIDLLFRYQSTDYRRAVCSAAISRTYLSSAFPKTTNKASNSSPKQQHPCWLSVPTQNNRMYRNQKRRHPSSSRHPTITSGLPGSLRCRCSVMLLCFFFKRWPPAGTKRRPSRCRCRLLLPPPPKAPACCRVVPYGDGASVPSFTLSAQRVCTHTSPSLFEIIS